MIAVSENHGASVALYHRVSSYLNGREPVDFATGLRSTDDGLRDVLGYARTAAWTPISKTADWAPVRKAEVQS